MNSTSTFLELAGARGVLYDCSTLLDRDLVVGLRRYLEDHGLDERSVFAAVGVMRVLPAWFFGRRRFDLEEVRGIEPTRAVVCEALDVDGLTTIDLLAWPVDRPEAFATFTGLTALLGVDQVYRHTTDDPPLPVHRTPLGWLQGQTLGVCPIDRHRAARLLLEVDGRLLAEDDAHGADLAAARADLVAIAPAIVVSERSAA